MKPVGFTSAAERDLVEICAYYEGQRPGLGIEFLDETAAIADIIGEYPRSGSVVAEPFRRRILPRFPYGIYYREDADEIRIVAILHLHRRPNAWIDRT